jgi:hypothetical protein
MTRRRGVWPSVMVAACLSMAARVYGHSGPPFPLVSDRVAGPYQLSVWSDPDATDNGAAAGQFWVMVALADGSGVPSDTRAAVAIRPADRPGTPQAANASAVNGDIGRQFAALLMDHEGRYLVQVTVTGSRGTAVVDTAVDATYDLRPARWLLGLYVMPFLAVGFLWTKLLFARRRRSGVRHGA